MQDPTSIVTGHERLTSIFGRWPSFHDAEVISIRLDREGRDQLESPVLYATVHVFAGRRNEDAIKFYNHTLVTFRFDLVVDLELSGFNNQNAIYDLEIVAPPDNSPETPIRVFFPSAFGVDMAFSCRSVEIVDVERKLPPNSVYEDSDAQ